MFTLTTFTTFLGWSLVINIGILLFSTFFIIVLRDFALNIHSKLFSLSKNDILKSYFSYLSQYKILLLIFNLAPYFALKIMGY